MKIPDPKIADPTRRLLSSALSCVISYEILMRDGISRQATLKPPTELSRKKICLNGPLATTQRLSTAPPGPILLGQTV